LAFGFQLYLACSLKRVACSGFLYLPFGFKLSAFSCILLSAFRFWLLAVFVFGFLLAA
jgi:hypothetical protein